MEILQKSESFDELDGVWQFVHVTIIYRVGDDIYYGISKNRQHFREPQTIRFEELTSRILILAEHYCPSFSPHLTQAPNPLPTNCYIKRPSLLSYGYLQANGKPTKISERVLREVEVCEILRSHPHPNIAQYLGCLVYEGRITGICFTKYRESLKDVANPGHHMKRHVINNDGVLKDCEGWLDGIEQGVQHLHSLGLIHNDINPTNIMRDDAKTPKLIDFDSCRPVGQSLEGVGRTYEWHDKDVQNSTPSNDLDALNEMREWLSGVPTKNFKFEE